MTATSGDFVNELRLSLEDYGNTITDSLTGDGTTTIWKLTSPPVKSASETIVVGGVTKVNGTDYTINYDNGEVTFTTAPANLTAVTIQYTSVIWRTERLISAANSGIRALYPLIYSGPKFVYIQLRTEVYEYDLTSTTDVPEISAFGDQTILPSYTPSTARTDAARAYTTMLTAEYRPYGANQVFTPYEFFRRPNPTMIQIDMDPAPSDTLRIKYDSSFWLFQVNSSTTQPSNVPEEFTDLVIWYALSVVMDKKEARRARYDQYPTMQNVNAVPSGTQAQTAEDFIKRFNEELARRSMKPQMRATRRRLRPFQYEMRGW